MLKIAWHPSYRLPLPEKHRFPMVKYELLPQQLLHEGLCAPANFFTPEMPELRWVECAHHPAYVQRLSQQQLDEAEVRRIGFPLTAALIEREFLIAQGTIKASEYALQDGIAMNIAGGTHHAFPDRGEAFCLLNDQAIAAHYLLEQKLAGKILMVDLDVHQGNGTAKIFENTPSVFTFSMHGAKNYPFRKEKSDLDIELPDGTGDQEYLSLLEDILPRLIQKEQPDFIFYLCGVDVIESDKLGRLGLTLEGCRQRDLMVLQICKHFGIPVQCSMGGGYSPDIRTIIEAHANTYRIADALYF